MKTPKILLILSLLAWQCTKEKVEIVFEKVEIPPPSVSDLNWRGVAFKGKYGVILGGNTWTKGVIAVSTDAGKTWRADSVAPAALLSVDAADTQNDNFVAVGVNGQLYEWQPTQHTNFGAVGGTPWFWGSDVARRGQNGVIVGGAAFAFGRILPFNMAAGASKTDSIRHELASVAFVDDTTLVTVGYGLMLRSTDLGKKWQPLTYKNDFFKAIQFVSEKIGYVVGYSGSILKTTDGGNTWQWLRNGDALVNSKKHFRALYFSDENTGWLVGDAGLMWQTKDGGDSWQIAKGLPEIDFYGIFENKQMREIWLVGDKNTVMKFKI